MKLYNTYFISNKSLPTLIAGNHSRSFLDVFADLAKPEKVESSGSGPLYTNFLEGSLAGFVQ